MKQRHKRTIRTVAWLIATLVVCWVVIAWKQGSRTASLVTGLLAAACLLLFFGLKLYGACYSWWYGRRLRRMSSGEQEAEIAKTLSEAASFLNELREERRRERERSKVPWYWQAAEALFGFAFAFGPPLLLTLFQHQPLSWKTEWTAYHLLAMGGGVGAYYLLRAYAIRVWRQRHSLR